VLLNCSGFHKASDNSINISGLCDKANDTQEATAETLELTNPTAANKLWGQIDKTIMTTKAPWVPLFNPTAGHLRRKTQRELPVLAAVRSHTASG